MVSNVDIVLAWKNASYRSSLSYEELALLPANPAGGIELPDELQNFADDDLESINSNGQCSTYLCMTVLMDRMA